MADPLRIVVHAYDKAELARSLAELQASLVQGYTVAASAAQKALLDAQKSAAAESEKITQAVVNTEADLVQARARAQKEAAKSAGLATRKYAEEAARAIVTSQDVTAKAIAHTQDQAKDQERVWVRVGRKVVEVGAGQEKAFRSLNAQVKRAMSPAEKIRLEMDILARTIAEVGDASGEAAQAMAGFQLKLERAVKREDINKGRTLSELIDQQTNSILSALGPWEGYARSVQSATNTVKDQIGKIRDLKDSGEAGAASIAAMAGVAGTLAAALIAAGTGAGVLAVEAAETIDHLDKMAQSTGLSTTELSQFQVLAEKAIPAGLDKLAEGFQKINERQFDAENGNEEYRKVLARLGVTGSTAEEQLVSLASGVERLGNTQERSALLTKLFGDGLARDLTPALTMGAAGISKLIAENERYGLVIDKEAIAKTAAFKDAQAELNGAIQGLKLAFADYLPYVVNLTNLTQYFVEHPLEALVDTITLGVIGGFQDWRHETRQLTEETQQLAEQQAHLAEFSGMLADAMSGNYRQAAQEAAERTAEFKGTLEALRSANDAAMGPQERHRRELEAMARAAGATTEEVSELLQLYDDKIRRDNEAASAAERHRKELERLAEQEAKRAAAALESAIATAEAESLGAAVGGASPELEMQEDTLAQMLENRAEFELEIQREIQATTDAELAALKARREATRETYLAVGGFIVDALGAAADAVEALGQDQARAELRAFRLRKASALGQVVIDTARTFANAMANIPAPGNLPAAIGLSALTAAQAIPIAAQQPPQTTHAGGMVITGPPVAGGAPLEVLNRAERGEGRVSRADMEAIGGGAALAAALAAVNRGSVSGGSHGAGDTYLNRRALPRGLERDYLAGGRSRDIVDQGRRRGLRRIVRS